ncbi:transcription termination/antitermination protein NusA [Candidatus Azambacteria bacterium]|nr:transcription termination/antitermination protein NusA [Candidatus Azambacteria bacterium]
MLDKKQFLSALTQICEEKGIDRGKVIEAIEIAMAAAYKKDYGKKNQIIKAKINLETNTTSFYQLKIVVDESMIYTDADREKRELNNPNEQSEESIIKKIHFNPETYIMIDEAQKIDPLVKLGDELKFDLEEQLDYGRIAAQTAKQIILQKIREVEKETIFKDFKKKEGEIISGIIQRIDNGDVIVDLGKIIGILPLNEQIKHERYQPGARLQAYILSANLSSKGTVIILSRTHPSLVLKIFEMEVPEIASKAVLIKSIAREAGSRTKIAVTSEEDGIDPIGSCVGLKGIRVNTIINELGGEKIDIIEWSENPVQFIKNSILPAKASSVEVFQSREALILVPEDQLSLAIGRDGQNVRLAAKLTGYRIDVRMIKKPAEEIPVEIIKEVSVEILPKPIENSKE